MLALRLLMAALAAAPALAVSVTPKVELDRDVVLLGQKRPVYVLVEFKVPEEKLRPGVKRPPVNLALVLDRSGSMKAQGKMEYAKRAAKVVVGILTPRDRLAVVEYDDRINVLWPSSPVEAPKMIMRLIDGLTPRGSTNLAGGMMKGVAEVRKNLDLEGINRVLLMSDGLANQGITRPSLIRQLARKARRQGVSISTAGLGLKYNEDLMQAIAEGGGANYYYIENPTSMARIFRQELATLYATVGKSAKLVFTWNPAVGKVSVFGYPHEIKDGRAVIPLENFYAGEKRSIVLRLEVNADTPGVLGLGQLELSYHDTRDNKPSHQVIELKVQVSRDEKIILASINKKVKARGILAEADKRHTEVVRLFEKGKRKEARLAARELAKRIETQNKGLGNLALKKKVEALRLEREVMRAAAASPQRSARYLKSSKQRLYNARRGKRGKSMLREGDRGLEVERLQKALRKRGLYKGRVDGRFTAKLTLAVKEFQRKSKMAPDGVAGPRTLRALGLY